MAQENDPSAADSSFFSSFNVFLIRKTLKRPAFVFIPNTCAALSGNCGARSVEKLLTFFFVVCS